MNLKSKNNILKNVVRFQCFAYLSLIIFLLAACDQPGAPDILKNCSYDAGWEDGYDGARLKCRDRDYLSGYDDGDFFGHCEWLKCTRKDREKFTTERCGNWAAYSC